MAICELCALVPTRAVQTLEGRGLVPTLAVLGELNLGENIISEDAWTKFLYTLLNNIFFLLRSFWLNWKYMSLRVLLNYWLQDAFCVKLRSRASVECWGFRELFPRNLEETFNFQLFSCYNWTFTINGDSVCQSSLTRFYPVCQRAVKLF